MTYATMFMIWLETPIVIEFREHILLHKRFLDGVFVVWLGSIPELCSFCRTIRASEQQIQIPNWNGKGLHWKQMQPILPNLTATNTDGRISSTLMPGSYIQFNRLVSSSARTVSQGRHYRISPSVSITQGVFFGVGRRPKYFDC